MNQTITELVANALRTGITHPGDDKPFQLHIFRTTGQPADTVELINATTQALAQAVVALIETDHDIIPKTQLAELRATATKDKTIVPVYCRNCDRAHQTPLLMLTVNGGSPIDIDANSSPALNHTCRT